MVNVFVRQRRPGSITHSFDNSAESRRAPRHRVCTLHLRYQRTSPPAATLLCSSAGGPHLHLTSSSQRMFCGIPGPSSRHRRRRCCRRLWHLPRSESLPIPALQLRAHSCSQASLHTPHLLPLRADESMRLRIHTISSLPPRSSSKTLRTFESEACSAWLRSALGCCGVATLRPGSPEVVCKGTDCCNSAACTLAGRHCCRRGRRRDGLRGRRGGQRGPSAARRSH